MNNWLILSLTTIVFTCFKAVKKKGRKEKKEKGKK
jgi:hypothetical protein